MNYFYWASVIAMPEPVVIQLVSDDDDSLKDTTSNIENEICNNVTAFFLAMK